MMSENDNLTQEQNDIIQLSDLMHHSFDFGINQINKDMTPNIMMSVLTSFVINEIGRRSATQRDYMLAIKAIIAALNKALLIDIYNTDEQFINILNQDIPDTH